jgi:type I restriction enzyme M protein
MRNEAVKINRELKNFDSLFQKIGIRHDYISVFDDFLTVFICCFGFGTNEELYLQTIKKYSREELEILARMMGELLRIYSEAKAKNRWVDPLGDFYEFLSSQSKKSALGQFFTPPALCDMMVKMVDDGEWGKTVNEPCSGSGRMVLAFNQSTKGNYYVCQDLDPMCTKMTAINLCMHEIKSEVHCMDTLKMSDIRFSFYINYELWKLETPHIIMKTPSN